MFSLSVFDLNISRQSLFWCRMFIIYLFNWKNLFSSHVTRTSFLLILVVLFNFCLNMYAFLSFMFYLFEIWLLVVDRWSLFLQLVWISCSSCMSISPADNTNASCKMALIPGKECRSFLNWVLRPSIWNVFSANA